jgi:hypothetical protein
MTNEHRNNDAAKIAAVDLEENPVLDFDDLLAGDILLFRAIAPDDTAQRISHASGSPYTHAAVYLGGGDIIEAGYPMVEKRQLIETDKRDYIIGVFRSQLGFSEGRVEALQTFADVLIASHTKYDLRGALKQKQTKTQFEEELLGLLTQHYGKVVSKEEFEQRSYFCSALVVACYTVSGVIGDTAQLAYKADAFSPADLHEDPTFGWFLGYITADRNQIPPDDPLMAATLWRDLSDARWW